MRRATTLMAIAVTSGACRIGFDAVGADAGPDAPATGNHDEDGDSVGDALDVCPHVPDVGQLDLDGDRVGDACDPNPATPGDHLVFFDPFTGQRPEWTLTGEPATFDGERLRVDTTGTRLVVAMLPVVGPTNERYVLGAHIVGLGPGQELIGLGLGLAPMFAPAGSPARQYYCETCFGGACGAPPFLSFTYTYDNMTFSQNRTFVAPFQPGVIALTFEQTPSMVECATTWPQVISVASTMPGAMTPDAVGIGLLNVVIDLDYFVHIHTD